MKYVYSDSLGALYNLHQNSKSWESNNMIETPVASLAISPDGDQLAIATRESLHLHSFPDASNDEIQSAVRRTLDITQVCYEMHGKHIFVASKEPGIIIYERHLKSKQFTISTHDVGVKSFAISPFGSILSFVDENATLFVVNLKFIQGPLSRQYNGSDESGRVCDVASLNLVRDMKLSFRTSWHSTIPLLAIPSKQGFITFLLGQDKVESTDQAIILSSYNSANSASNVRWKEILLVADPNSAMSHGSSDVNIVSFSPHGNYLASSDVNGKILIWNVNLKDLSNCTPIAMYSASNSQILHDIAWGTEVSSNYLMITTLNSWYKIDNVIKAELGVLKPNDIALNSTIKQSSTITSVNIATQKNNQTVQPSNLKRLNKVSVSTASLLTPASKAMRNLVIDSTSLDNTESTSIPMTTMTKTTEDSDDDNLLDEAQDNLDSVKKIKQSLKTQARELLDANDDEKSTVSDAINEANVIINEMKSSPLVNLSAFELQPPFQPSCSKPDELMRKYLVWNTVGNITSREEPISNRVEIRFTNTAGNNKNETFPDNYGFTKAALSFEGTVL